MRPIYKPMLEIIVAIFLFVAGYFVAVFNFKEETWIDVTSGRVQGRMTLFPYSEKTTDADRFFEVMFQSNSNSAPNWKLVRTRRFVSVSGRTAYTEGKLLLTAQNRLTYICAIRDFSSEDIRRIEQNFFGKLREGGVDAVSKYVNQLWEETLAVESTDG